MNKHNYMEVQAVIKAMAVNEHMAAACKYC